MHRLGLVVLVLAAGGAVWWTLRSDDPPSRRGSADRPRVEPEPDPAPDPVPDEGPPPPRFFANPDAAVAAARAEMRDFEEREARILVPLFAMRGEVCAELFRNGLVAEEQLRLAEFEQELNRMRGGAAPDAAAAVATRLKEMYAALQEAGRVPPSHPEAYGRALDAALAAHAWFASPLRGPVRETGRPPDARPLRMPDLDPEGRLAEFKRINIAILKTREKGLRLELSSIDGLLKGLPPDHPDATAFRVRRVVARALLHEVSWSKAQERAKKLIETAPAGQRADLEALAGLLDWHASALIDRLYVD